MTERSQTVRAAVRDLVIANRILAREGVVDAFGHISIRHPENPGRYFLARSRSPELVVEEDLIEFDLDSNAIDLGNRLPYAERFIHGCRAARGCPGGRQRDITSHVCWGQLATPQCNEASRP